MGPDMKKSDVVGILLFLVIMVIFIGCVHKEHVDCTSKGGQIVRTPAWFMCAKIERIP